MKDAETPSLPIPTASNPTAETTLSPIPLLAAIVAPRTRAQAKSQASPKKPQGPTKLPSIKKKPAELKPKKIQNKKSVEKLPAKEPSPKVPKLSAGEAEPLARTYAWGRSAVLPDSRTPGEKARTFRCVLLDLVELMQDTEDLAFDEVIRLLEDAQDALRLIDPFGVRDGARLGFNDRRRFDDRRIRYC